MRDYQILLLPQADFASWVAAAKDFVLRFNLSVSADPEGAALYMAPQQVISYADVPTGYPAVGDLAQWFARHYPSLRLDPIACTSPATLKQALQARLATHDRYGDEGRPFQLGWPTDIGQVTQKFGENPTIYRRQGLPGHPGLDVRVAPDGPVYVGADGVVLAAEPYVGDPVRQPYGSQVIVQHRLGYQTCYGHLGRILVKAGQTLNAGDVLGQAGSSGQSTGHYVHLALAKTGATAAGLTTYPQDQIDPAPFLQWLPEANTATAALTFSWPFNRCLVGVQGRVDGPLQGADFTVFSRAKVEAVKLLSAAQPEDVEVLRVQNKEIFCLVRLFAALAGRNYAPTQFAQDMRPTLQQFYDQGLRYFEVHNEPNLRAEGWGTSWADGQAFGAWFLTVFNQLKQWFPEAQLGYPGLSPGNTVAGVRLDADEFLAASAAATLAADWVGVHCYWQNEQEMLSPRGGNLYQVYRQRLPSKLLFITEFGNVAANVDKVQKGQQYVAYYEQLRGQPGVGAAFAFAVSASAGFQAETWRNEDGSLTPIVNIVGARRV